jgi:NhaA family Na+:H+ antiporter
MEERKVSQPTGVLRQLLSNEATSGVLLALFAALALAIANSPLQPVYQAILDTEVAVKVGDAGLEKPFLLWVNDGLMAVFFLLVGLELKRALLQGELSNVRQAALPAIAALGGMIVPVLIYAAINWGDALALRGWAIPAATDIAFALGVLALLGPRVPIALKMFLMAVAVIDDLGAILIIAFFYTESLTPQALLWAGVAISGLALLNRFGVASRVPYILLGAILWFAVLKSGVHATLAGVVLAAFIPLRASNGSAPALTLEHDLHPWVALGVLPMFAFANAGVSFAGLTPGALLEPIPFGIAAGLLVGKIVGVCGFAVLAVRLRLAAPPPGIGLLELLGVAALCGIGFTMSLFMGSLAFEHGGAAYAAEVRLGILSGSLLAGIIGYTLLRTATARREGRAPAVLAEAR